MALFKQAVDDRDATGRDSRRVSRVAFGTGWVRAGPLELLEESVRLHEPVLPVLGPEEPLARLEDGGVPALDELRALPSGPTVTDMAANAAFLLGLTLALAGDAGVLAEEADGLLEVVAARTATGRTGAAWQRQALAGYERDLDRGPALAAMLERYLELQHQGDPVHTWPLPG